MRGDDGESSVLGTAVVLLYRPSRFVVTSHSQSR